MPSVFLLAGARELVGETSPWLRSPLWTSCEHVWSETGLVPKSCGLWDGLTLYPEAPVLQSVQRETPPIQCTEAPSPHAAQPRLEVTCVQAPLGAACASYGETAVAQVTELGEGGGGVYGISPDSKGICG